MEDIIKQIIQCMTKEPVVKEMIEKELRRTDVTETEKTYNNGLLSRITITSDYKLYLNDYDNQEINIKSYQARTLYLFYLISPVQVSNIELVKYMDVMKIIYANVCNHSTNDEYRADTFVKGLLTRKGGISDATHKINEALNSIIKYEQARRYYLINGKRGEKRYIILPKQLITIENSTLHRIILRMTETEL